MATTKRKLIREYNDQGQLVNKQCGNCKELKPIDQFYVKGKISRNNIDGYGHKCILCSKEYWHKQAENPEKRKRWLLERIKSKCKTNNIPFDLTIDDLTIPDVCPVLGIPLKFGVKTPSRFRDTRGVQTPDDSPSVDRIFPELGYIKGNVVIVSYRANLIKTNASPEELQLVASFYKQYCGKARKEGLI